MHKILFIDDDMEMGLIVKTLLDPIVSVEHVYLRNDVKKCLESNTYNMFIVDLQLPDSHGYDIFSMIRNDAKHSGAPIVFLSGENSEQSALTGFGLGADDYIFKPIKAAELRSRILDKLQTFSNSPDSNLHLCGPLIVDLLSWQTFVTEKDGSKRLIPLTPLEFRILCTFLNFKNQTLERKFLIKEVWGDGIAITNRVVDQHVQSLLRKIHTGTELIQTVYGTGYKLVTEDERSATYPIERILESRVHM